MRRFLCSCLFLLGFSASLSADSTEEKFFRRQLDLSRVIFIGDSLTSGFQNGTLLDEFQRNNYPALLAQQCDFELVQPELTAPGVPPKLVLDSVDPLVIRPYCKLPSKLDPTPENSCLAIPARSNQTMELTNLSVPGATLGDAVHKRPFNNSANPLTDLILGFPGVFMSPKRVMSQLELAEELKPSLAIVWLGSNDVLGFASSGGMEPLTDLMQFSKDCDTLVRRLRESGADVLIANIADATIGAYLLTAAEFAELALGEGGTVEQLPFLNEDDYVRLEGVDTLVRVLQGEEVDSEEIDAAILDAEEAFLAARATRQYNRVIRRVARRYGAIHLNIFKMMRRIERKGVHTKCYHLTTDFLGGLFSLDGMHPTNTGYAVVANAIIKKLNRRFRAELPYLDLDEIAHEDPLVLSHEERPRCQFVAGGLDGEGIRDMKRVAIPHQH